MYILHYRPDAASLPVRIVLNELARPYQTVLLDRATAQHKNSAYRRLHPLGLVPVLETPDGPIFETAAILLWLADHHGRLAPAPMSPERAAFLKWFFFVSSNIHPTLLQIFYPERYAGSEAAIPDFTRMTIARMEVLLTLLDDMARTDKPVWFSADTPSILGYYFCVLARWLKSIAADHPAYIDMWRFAALSDIASGLEIRPAVQAAAEAEGLGATIFTKPE